MILYSLYWPNDHDKPARESGDWAKCWARLAAANGIVAIIPDLPAEPGTGNATQPARARGPELEEVLTHVRAKAVQYGIDQRRLVLFAASGNAGPALSAIQAPSLPPIRAAVLYYGGAGAHFPKLRRDVSLLLVRAGRDSPTTNGTIDALVARALLDSVPVTLINHETGRHGFEFLDADPRTHQVVRETLDFIAHTLP